MDEVEVALLSCLYEGGSGSCRIALALLDATGCLHVGSLTCSSEADLIYTLSTVVELPMAPTHIFCNSLLPESAKCVLGLCGPMSEDAPAEPVAVTPLKASQWDPARAKETLGRLRCAAPLESALDPMDALLVRCTGGLVRYAVENKLWAGEEVQEEEEGGEEGGEEGRGEGGGGGRHHWQKRQAPLRPAPAGRHPAPGAAGCNVH